MSQHQRIDYWSEAQGGFRGSHLLLGGAVLLIAGALLALAAGAPAAGVPAPRAGLMVAGWLVYALGLAVTGLGFGWPVVAGILPRMALAVAAVHLAQAAHLLVLLSGRLEAPLSPTALTVGRLLALVLFAILATRRLGTRTAGTLGGVAGAALLKTLLRVMAPAVDGGPVVDAILLVALGVAIGALARRLRALEDVWAREHHHGHRTDFSEFNNPEHVWNKPGDAP